jgi:hypothetical protein
MAPVLSAFTVGGKFLSSAEKTALEETAAVQATPGKGTTACDERESHYEWCSIGGRGHTKYERKSI